MPCPHCRSTATTKRNPRTTLGYPRFNCRACGRRFNERTGTPFNDLQHPTDIVLLAVLWRLRYKLSFRDVAELLLQRGYAVTHETVRDWEFRFAPLLANRLRAKRRGRTGVSWYIDETYVKVAGRWCYLYRAIDREGALIDSMLSAHRDKHAARRFLRGLLQVAERKPLRITRAARGLIAAKWGNKAWRADPTEGPPQAVSDDAPADRRAPRSFHGLEERRIRDSRDGDEECAIEIVVTHLARRLRDQRTAVAGGTVATRLRPVIPANADYWAKTGPGE